MEQLMISKTKTFWQPCLATKGEQRAQKKKHDVEMDDEAKFHSTCGSGCAFKVYLKRQFDQLEISENSAVII